MRTGHESQLRFGTRRFAEPLHPDFVPDCHIHVTM